MRPLVFGEPVVPTLEKRDYSRLIGTEFWRNFEAALEGRAGADCRGSGFRPVASFLSLSGTRFSPPVPWKLNEALLFPSSHIYIYIYTFAKWLPTGHGSWRILRPTGVISLKDSRRCFLSHTYNGYESFNAGRLGLKREEIERILFREERCVNFDDKSICFAWHLK